MKHYSKYFILTAIALSALAGYVDAVGFLQLGGYFVSFMSGNSTRLAVNLVQGDWHHAILIGAIILFFICGSALGTIIGQSAGEARQSKIVLLFVTTLLTLALLFYGAGFTLPTILFMTLAMGAENTIFQRDGDITIGLTYMTGTLAKCGQRIAQALRGGDRLAWAPYLFLWLGLVCGGATGVFLFQLLGLDCLWIAILWAASLTFFIRK